MSPRWQSNLLLGKHFDFITYDVDTTIVRCVELENTVTEMLAEEFMGKAENAGGLTSTRGTLFWKVYKEFGLDKTRTIKMG